MSDFENKFEIEHKIDIDTSPRTTRKEKRKKDERSVKKRWKGALTPTQLNEMIERSYNISEKHGLIVLLQAKSGFRISEIANLVVGNLNFKANEISVEYRESEDEVGEYKAKTASSYRTIMMSKEMMDKISTYVKKNEIKDGFVFRPYGNSKSNEGYNSTSLINFIDKISRECNSIGKNIGSHALRRTFASMLLEESIPITQIQKLLGHAQLKTTLLYLKDIVTPKMQENIRNAMEKIGK